MKFSLYTDIEQRVTPLVTLFGKKKNQGMTMLVSLVFLLAIGLMGSSAINGITLNTKIVSSTRNHYIALNNAEAALISAAALFKNPDLPPECHTNAEGFLEERQSGIWWNIFNWTTDGQEKTYEGAPKQSYIAIEPPLIGASPYSFDSLSHDNNVLYNYYRVTSRGEGANQSNSYVQGIFIMKVQKNVSC